METHNLPVEKPKLSPAALTILWIAKLGAASILGGAAWLKLNGHEPDIRLFEELQWEPSGRYLIGGIEVVAAILILIPQSAIFGAFLGLGIMMGALIGHFSVDSEIIGVFNIWKPLTVIVPCLVILYIKRHDAKFIQNLFAR